jgi:hypothetical protein
VHGGIADGRVPLSAVKALVVLAKIHPQLPLTASAGSAGRQEEAIAFNDELGAAVVRSLSRLRVDERLVKILAAVDLHGELGKIALLGARYGFPVWVVHKEPRRASRSSSSWPATRRKPRRAAICRARRAWPSTPGAAWRCA